MITLQTILKAPIEKVWELWISPEHITQWNHASADWHTPYAENDLKVGGKFKYTMAAKDGSMQFDFGGTYTEIVNHSLIAYTIDDGRKVKITFESQENGVEIIEKFDPETENSEALQQQGWQAILDNFKKHVESIYLKL